MARLNSLSFLFLLFLCACTSSSPEAKKVSAEEKKTDYQEFNKAFSKVKLPYILPDMDEGSAVELDKKYIRLFFDNAAFKPVLDEGKDVPDLTENIESSKYYAAGMLKGEKYDGLIIYKEDDNDYYYLCTFSKDGKYKDGMCIAFVEGPDDDQTQRTASINEDLSVEIRQKNTVNGRKDNGEESRFFEISPEGDIQMLKNNNNPSQS